jgi:hypothetical protein
MSVSARALTNLLAGVVLLLGAGLVVFRLSSRRPLPVPPCRETVLDPDPTGPPDLSGSLHLEECPTREGWTQYHLSISDYLRRPPVVGGILSGSVAGARAGFDVIGAHWISRDTLLVDFSPDLRVTWRNPAVGPVRVRFVAKRSAN